MFANIRKTVYEIKFIKLLHGETTCREREMQVKEDPTKRGNDIKNEKTINCITPLSTAAEEHKDRLDVPDTETDPVDAESEHMEPQLK